MSKDKARLAKHASFFHFVVKIVTFTRTLTNTGKHRVTTVEFSNVVNKLGDKNGLTDTRTSKQASFTALNQRSNQVNNLNASLQDFGLI